MLVSRVICQRLVGRDKLSVRDWWGEKLFVKDVSLEGWERSYLSRMLVWKVELLVKDSSWDRSVSVGRVLVWLRFGGIDA